MLLTFVLLFVLVRKDAFQGVLGIGVGAVHGERDRFFDLRHYFRVDRSLSLAVQDGALLQPLLEPLDGASLLPVVDLVLRPEIGEVAPLKVMVPAISLAFEKTRP